MSDSNEMTEQSSRLADGESNADAPEVLSSTDEESADELEVPEKKKRAAKKSAAAKKPTATKVAKKRKSSGSKPKAKVAKKKAEGKSGEGEEKKKRNKKRQESYARFIYKVLKQVHPEVGMSGKSMAIMESFVQDIYSKLTVESARLAQYTKRNTVLSRDIMASARLVLPGELSKHAVQEGTKALAKYSESK